MNAITNAHTEVHENYCRAIRSAEQNVRDALRDTDQATRDWAAGADVHEQAVSYVRDGSSSCTCGGSRPDLPPTRLALVQLAGILEATDSYETTHASEAVDELGNWITTHVGEFHSMDWAPVMDGNRTVGLVWNAADETSTETVKVVVR